MNIKKPYVEIEEIARYETDTYLFFLVQPILVVKNIRF